MIYLFGQGVPNETKGTINLKFKLSESYQYWGYFRVEKKVNIHNYEIFI